MRFLRECDKATGGCGKLFRPDGKFQKKCNNCRDKIRHVNFIRMISMRNSMPLKQIGEKEVNYVWKKEKRRVF